MRYELLLQLKQQLETSLSKAPDGKICILNSNGRLQFYLRKNPSEKNGKYISKKEKATIQVYVQKAYEEKIYKIIKNELSGLSKLLETTDKNLDNQKKYGNLNINPNEYIFQIQQAFSNNPDEIKALINPIDLSDKDYADAWMSMSFNPKPIPDNLPLYETNRKERVRSKSELTIANTLAKYEIPYKYECPFKLNNGSVIYPDFTVLNVRERKEIYWEHRGMMDDIDYARHAIQRNKSYLLNGVCLGKNLIITEETSINPLGTNEIETIITEYLL